MTPPRYPLLAAFWSVAIPGFGQMYNRKFLKGCLFIILEFIINVNSHLNLAIFYSWLWKIEQAQTVINYEWLLFYPCFYVYSIFDAYYDCCVLMNKSVSRWIGVPFIASCTLGTVIIIIGSGQRQLAGIEKLGPIFLGVLVLVIVLAGGAWLVKRYGS